jgi:hypothetical protein
MAEITKEDIATSNQIAAFDELVDIQATSIAAPAPKNIKEDGTSPTIENKLVEQSVTLSKVVVDNIVLQSANTYDVSFDSVNVDEDITNEVINRTAKSLQTSVNAQLEALRKDVQAMLRDVMTQNNSNIGTAQTDLNTAFTAIYDKGVAQIAETQRVVDLANGALVLAFKEVTDNNKAQNEDIARLVNDQFGVVFGLCNTLREGVNRAQEELAAMDTFFRSESERADFISNLTTTIELFQKTGADVVKGLNWALDELNSRLKVTQPVELTIASADGTVEANFETIGWGGFADISDLMVIPYTSRAETEIREIARTNSSIKYQVLKTSSARNTVLDCTDTNVKVTIVGFHMPRNPARLDIAMLDGSYVADADAVQKVEVAGDETLTAPTI